MPWPVIMAEPAGTLICEDRLRRTSRCHAKPVGQVPPVPGGGCAPTSDTLARHRWYSVCASTSVPVRKVPLAEMGCTSLERTSVQLMLVMSAVVRSATRSPTKLRGTEEMVVPLGPKI